MDCFIVDKGMIYEARIKLLDNDGGMVQKCAEGAVAPSTIITKWQWAVTPDQAKYLAIRQRQDVVDKMKRELDDMEHTFARIPARVDANALTQLRTQYTTESNILRMYKADAPPMFKFPTPAR